MDLLADLLFYINQNCGSTLLDKKNPPSETVFLVGGSDELLG